MQSTLPSKTQPFETGEARRWTDREGGGTRYLDGLASDASEMGFEIVEISGMLDGIDADSRAQLASLSELKAGANRVLDANGRVGEAAERVRKQTESSRLTLEELLTEIRRSEPSILDLANWVGGLDARIGQVSAMLADVRKSNALITAIAKQVNILAINAKIEAARAGDAGRGFAVVAEEVNELSRRTSQAANRITGQVALLDNWITDLSSETGVYGTTVADVQEGTARTSDAVDKMRIAVEDTGAVAEDILSGAEAVKTAGDGFQPSFLRIDEGAADTAGRIAGARDRLEALIDLSESLVQGTVAAGGTSDDDRFIRRVTEDAATMGRLFERAIAEGEIGEQELFVRHYTPIAGSDPEQVVAPFTHLTDRLFPPIQEAALDLDDRVVFCAAVATGGYLPTHNRKFSQPQGSDPVWNTANCRNRRIFDDRVGLKASRNTEPFLLQVYRRDMGGGEFRMMKDLSAPIIVGGRHWGGLRLAYLF